MTFMPEENLKATQLQLGCLLPIIADLPLVEFVNHWEHFDAVGPILDPTTYRRGMSEAEKWRRIGEALLPVQRLAKDAVKALAPIPPELHDPAQY